MKAAGIIAVLAVLVGVVYYFASPSGSGGAKNGILNAIKEDKITLNGMRLTQKKDNETEMEIVAQSASIALDESSTDLSKFTVVSHSKKHGVLTLNGEKGILVNATQDITASGGVLFRDNMGRALATDNVKWINSAKEIRTDDVVRIFGDRFVLIGKGMIVHMEEEKVEILSNVRVTFFPGGNG